MTMRCATEPDVIAVSETEEGEALAEAKIKQMTGGDVLKARPLYGKYIQFEIIGKILLATNSLPSINNTDHGIWRQIHAILFSRTLTAEEQNMESLNRCRQCRQIAKVPTESPVEKFPKCLHRLHYLH